MRYLESAMTPRQESVYDPVVFSDPEEVPSSLPRDTESRCVACMARELAGRAPDGTSGVAEHSGEVSSRARNFADRCAECMAREAAAIH